MSTSETRESIEWRKDLLRRRVLFQIPDVAVLNAVHRKSRVNADHELTLEICGLPEGFDLIGCWYSHATRSFEFVALHESFELVQDGTMPPTLNVTHHFKARSAEPTDEVQALRAERDRLRVLLGKLCQAESPEEARKMIEFTLQMPPSDDRELAIEALKELAGGAA